jgi:hypothetical protein
MRLDAELIQQTYAPYPQQHFLDDPRLAIAPNKWPCKRSVSLFSRMFVSTDTGDASHISAHTGTAPAVRNHQFNQRRRAVRQVDAIDQQVGRMSLAMSPPIAITAQPREYPLTMSIPMATDGNCRSLAIEMIAGQHSEATQYKGSEL